MKDVNVKNVAKWYMSGLWSMAMVEEAVAKGKLTEAEAEKISKLPVRGEVNGVSD